MHRLVIDVNENVLDKIIYFLNHLPQKDVRVLRDEVIEENTKNTSIDFSQYNIESFKKIENPVDWQQQLRKEWD